MCLQEKQEKAYLPHREDKPFLFMQILYRCSQIMILPSETAAHSFPEPLQYF